MYSEYKKILKSILRPDRYDHSLGVADTARQMAMAFGEDLDKAYIAGLVHDCAKNIPKDELYTRCEQYGYLPDDVEAASAQLIHAPLGALMLGDLFGIEDEDIKLAVRYHTVAAPGMSKLSKIIYLADMIEPNRSYNGVDILRRLARVDLDKAYYTALKMSLEFINEKGATAHPNTLLALQDMKGTDV